VTFFNFSQVAKAGQYNTFGYKIYNAQGTPYSNWSSALIQFGGPEWSRGIYPFNQSNKNAIKHKAFAHEIGHAVGLAHNSDFSYMSIMRPVLDDIPDSVQGPWSNDLYGVNSLY